VDLGLFGCDDDAEDEDDPFVASDPLHAIDLAVSGSFPASTETGPTGRSPARALQVYLAGALRELQEQQPAFFQELESTLGEADQRLLAHALSQEWS
jgi:hypothetical protein